MFVSLFLFFSASATLTFLTQLVTAVHATCCRLIFYWYVRSDVSFLLGVKSNPVIEEGIILFYQYRCPGWLVC
jgi:hypothetical protein